MIRVLLPLLMAAVSFSAVATGSAQSIPADVKTSLEKYALLDPIAFYWQGTDTLKAWQPQEQYSVAGSYFRRGRRFAWLEEVKEGDTPRRNSTGRGTTTTCRFDGAVVSATHGTNDASWYSITKLIEKQPTLRRFQLPYCDAIGIYCPTQQQAFLQEGLQSNILYLLQHGGTLLECASTEFAQESVVRIEIEAANPQWEEFIGGEENNLRYQQDRLANKNITQEQFDAFVKIDNEQKAAIPQRCRWVYYLSPAHNFAVASHERLTLSGKVMVAYHNSDFQPVPERDVILPQRITEVSFVKSGVDGYSVEDTPAEVKELSLTKVSTSPIADDAFVLRKNEVVPGAIVIDAVTPNLQRADGTVITYVMPASPADLEEVIAVATGKYTLNNKPSFLRYVGIYSAVLLLFLFLAYRVYSTRREAHSGVGAGNESMGS